VICSPEYQSSAGNFAISAPAALLGGVKSYSRRRSEIGADDLSLTVAYVILGLHVWGKRHGG
jgi:hypothetical protein